MSDPYHFRYIPPWPLTHDPSSTMMPQPALLGHKQRYDPASDVRWTPQSSSSLDLHPMVHTIRYCTPPKGNSNDLPNSDSRRRRVDDRTNLDHLPISRFTTRYPPTPSQKDVVCSATASCVSPSSALRLPRIWQPRLAERRTVIPSLGSSPLHTMLIG